MLDNPFWYKIKDAYTITY